MLFEGAVKAAFGAKTTLASNTDNRILFQVSCLYMSLEGFNSELIDVVEKIDLQVLVQV